MVFLSNSTLRVRQYPRLKGLLYAHLKMRRADRPGNRPFPTALDPFTFNRYECTEFAREAFDISVRYIGLCCGTSHIGAVAEALYRTVPGSRCSRVSIALEILLEYLSCPLKTKNPISLKLLKFGKSTRMTLLWR
jgi:hypothetical protein